MEPYLRSGLSFYMAGYVMEQNRRENVSSSFSMYKDTASLLEFAANLRASSSSNHELSDKDRKLQILILRLRSLLNHRLYKIKKNEVSKYKKAIESDQNKLNTSAPPAAPGHKPHAPSPHQGSWNKNSTGTLSPMSPTASPAGSVSSQGSGEQVTGKMLNGTASSSSTPMTSPSPGIVSVQQRLLSMYFRLTNPMVTSLELWDQANAETTRDLQEFFKTVDDACGELSFHSLPPVVVRYMEYALRVLHL
ncbi:AF4/FMR2 family member 3 [Aplysia californica]|uniref:AF4/FMR2 family member lilli n=1 Tax=Aplysia californica TaxID=6500 RepID=A0ABM0ZX23_APLCA|nr:AF4/FMR2 family member 3 [Aplysia californica]